MEKEACLHKKPLALSKLVIMIIICIIKNMFINIIVDDQLIILIIACIIKNILYASLRGKAVAPLICWHHAPYHKQDWRLAKTTLKLVL